MLAPLILTALLPLNPALFMRELVCWFICIFLDTLDNPETRAWIKANPKDRSVLLDLLGSLVMIEDMISAFTFIRAGQRLGYSHRPGRKGRRPSYNLTGRAPTLEEIERRFQRALQRLDAVERNSESLAAKLARLLTNAVSQLQRVHHPVESTTTIPFTPDSTIPPAPDSTTTILQTLASTTIPRGPPWRGARLGKQTPPDPQASPARSHRHA